MGINGGYFPAICRVCLGFVLVLFMYLLILLSFAVLVSIFLPFELLKCIFFYLFKFCNMLWLRITRCDYAVLYMHATQLPKIMIFLFLIVSLAVASFLLRLSLIPIILLFQVLFIRIRRVNFSIVLFFSDS